MRSVRIVLSGMLMLALLSACGGKSSAADSQVPVRPTGNPVDQIIAEQQKESAAKQKETAPQLETAARKEESPAQPEETAAEVYQPAPETELPSDPWLQEDYVYEAPENMSHDGIDVDLTVLSPTLVYAEVFNMVSYAPDYVGKTIRMEGPAVSFTDEEIGKTYYACLIQDATACCATGLEYVLPEGSEYPEDDEEIIVTGVFDTYVDVDGIEYCRLLDAVMGNNEADKG